MIRKIIVYLYSFKLFKRIIPSLIRKLTFFANGNTIFLDDFKINLFLTSSIDREIYLKNQYEKDQLDFVKKEMLNHKYDYFFDIGAYIGYYSLSLCKLVTKTAAFEPNKQNFQRLSKNVEINNFDIRCHNLGCSDSKNKLKLWYTDKNKRGGSSILQESDKELNKYDKSKLLFDLRGYVSDKLVKYNIKVDHVNRDTFKDKRNFFSYRRATLLKQKDYGRCISVIKLV